MDQNDNKDQNVLSFMMQLVQEKHGDEVDADFLKTEAERLYLEFGDSLVDYFEPMLSSEKKQEFDGLVESGAQQDSIMSFLLESIPDLEKKIMEVLVEYRTNYLAE